MSGRLQAVPEGLLVSAGAVDGYASDLAAAHGAADAELGAAQAGLTGISAAAVIGKAADWQTVTAVLGARLATHGAGLSSGGVGYQVMDEVTNAESLRDVVSEAIGYIEG